MSFENWDDGQPKKGDTTENCACIHMSYGPFKWHDYPCSDRFYFICQYSKQKLSLELFLT